MQIYYNLQIDFLEIQMLLLAWHTYNLYLPQSQQKHSACWEGADSTKLIQ